MTEVDRTTRRMRRGRAWLYMLGGALGLLALYGFFFRRQLVDVSLWDSLVRAPIVALLGVALGWFVYRLDSRSS